MMEVGEPSKKPKREFDEIGPHNIELEGRPPWDIAKHQYKENPHKSYGAREPLGHTYSGKLLIIERSSLQLWPAEIDIWEQYVVQNWFTNER